ncbi:phosphoenolpyruvate mutase [Serratia plymuthica]|jgi:phosphoenolpyruvate phosphomutase|uniref:phosphoenolpyruvate mutase n=2 Tax=Serratia plymuthica TaxID=82996 RepID=A0A318P457_SERPL|nr:MULTISPECIES: phosphoenolpyruvate mutase [Serratia]AGO55979.1 phosphoenolpyruvate phosphomutase BcpB [Serratia plymuthica 4Rx13]AHY08202.1 phosphoenolpyruvate phosphomutase [Serratia plymuthica]ANJ95104.1 phosphoenolpyruvate phosphomutase [Serratia plymuthica]ANJ99439.1 phosphoenolpyruvate phosphomutase [Serratia plymuthica]EKF63657.1 phosphoenolpyruvate phosphomutase [Serratia plymuthica A30]
MRKTSALKNILQKKELSFLMEAHNAMSAKIAEESGFEALWASGLSISASMGLSDRNEASWTQVMDVVDFMVDNTAIPILLDGDTGFGNFNNVRRLVKKLSQRGVAGVCLEDKLFPKINSFIGAGQDLASISEFCGKIQAAKDSQLDSDFCVVARVEALISGCPMEEALKRADAYASAGADAVLIHSKQSDGAEIMDFCRQWQNDCPIVIVPTKYYNTATDAFREVGVSTVIWANHSLRASIAAMRAITRNIRQHNSVAQIEREIASLDDVFKLTNEYEVQLAEQKYLTL